LTGSLATWPYGYLIARGAESDCETDSGFPKANSRIRTGTFYTLVSLHIQIMHRGSIIAL
jgi:hypothetical protein